MEDGDGEGFREGEREKRMWWKGVGKRRGALLEEREKGLEIEKQKWKRS